MSELRYCPRCNSILWLCVTEDSRYLCPWEDEEYEVKNGVLVKAGGWGIIDDTQ